MLYTYLYCFFIYAFLGWCGEVLYAAAIEKRFVNRGFLNGPDRKSTRLNSSH